MRISDGSLFANMSDSETASEDDLTRPVAKRRRIGSGEEPNKDSPSDSSRPITPPPLRRVHGKRASSQALDYSPKQPSCVASPFQLTSIEDLPDSSNVDSVRLSDILEDPLIRETWQFNFLIDLDFMMYVPSSAQCYE